MLEKAQERDSQARAFEKDIRKFGEIVKDDQALLDKLDATPDKSAFVDLYIRLANEQGISFSKDDLLIAVQEQKTGHDWIIPGKVLRMIAERF